jgi:integrase
VAHQKLIDQVRDAIRVKHYSPRTEEAYWNWIKRFIIFHNKRHPNDMAESEISSFPSDLAVNKRVSASTQNQALSSILFLYNEVLKKPLDWIDNISRAKRPSRLPVVFTRQEVQSILRNLEGTKWLMAALLYGAGLRLTECLRLRVKDLDFSYGQLIVRDGKGSRPHQRYASLVEGALNQTPREGKGTSSARPEGGLRQDDSAVRTRSKVSKCRTRVGLAICFSFGKGLLALRIEAGSSASPK